MKPLDFTHLARLHRRALRAQLDVYPLMLFLAIALGVVAGLLGCACGHCGH